jgi:L-glyceraldehyde reductase
MQKEGIVVEAYSPLGNNIYNLPRGVDDEAVVAIAKRLGKQPAQVLIQWAAQRGTVVLPKSVTPQRIADNFEDFELPQDVFEEINKLDRNHRYNFPIRLGVDIFGEHDEATLKKGVSDWVEAQRKLKAASAAK